MCVCVCVCVCEQSSVMISIWSPSYQGEVEVEPMIAEEPKLVWSAPPDFESFEKELEELRQNVLEKVRRREGK